MGIPIYVSRVPRTQPLPPVQGPCHNCRAVTMHEVVRHYFSVHVYFLPMGSGGTQYEHVCFQCRASTRGVEPRGAPSKPFLHRFGCLVFLGVPLLGLVGYAAIDKWQSNRRMADFRLAEEARLEQAAQGKILIATAKSAVATVEAARKACSVNLDAALNSFPQKVLDLPAKKPADPAPLAGASYTMIKHALEDYYIPIPSGKYFGAPACFVEVPPAVSNAAAYGTLPVSPAERQKLDEDARALSEKAKTLTTPSIFVITDLGAAARDKKKLQGAAVWVSTTEKRVLAVVRVEKVMEHLAGKEDRSGLAKLLADETAKW